MFPIRERLANTEQEMNMIGHDGDTPYFYLSIKSGDFSHFLFKHTMAQFR